jgi:hypothetical protein
MERIKKIILQIGIVSLLTLILLEISIAIAANFGKINILMPTYSLSYPERFMPERSMIFGHRHSPNSSFRVKKNCIDNYYQFNEFGFRDSLPSLQSTDKRVIVIGDSFMEGVGVAENERLSDVIENSTGIKHINFGMADKGTTQAFVIYDSLASKFDHDMVLFSIFPQNDVIDDDPSKGKSATSIRPCWVGNYPDFELQFVPNDAPTHKSTSGIKKLLKRFTYSYDALFSLKEAIKYRLHADSKKDLDGYFNYTNDQLDRMKHSILKLQESAGNKPITVICIPAHIDFSMDKNHTTIEEPLKFFCDSIGVEFIGLKEGFQSHSSDPRRDFYLTCDAHWSPFGHQVAAQYTLDHSINYNNLITNKTGSLY